MNHDRPEMWARPEPRSQSPEDGTQSTPTLHPLGGGLTRIDTPLGLLHTVPRPAPATPPVPLNNGSVESMAVGLPLGTLTIANPDPIERSQKKIIRNPLKRLKLIIQWFEILTKLTKGKSSRPEVKSSIQTANREESEEAATADIVRWHRPGGIGPFVRPRPADEILMARPPTPMEQPDAGSDGSPNNGENGAAELPGDTQFPPLQLPHAMPQELTIMMEELVLMWMAGLRAQDARPWRRRNPEPPGSG